MKRIASRGRLANNLGVSLIDVPLFKVCEASLKPHENNRPRDAWRTGWDSNPR